jgi:hypothetical protein
MSSVSKSEYGDDKVVLDIAAGLAAVCAMEELGIDETTSGVTHNDVRLAAAKAAGYVLRWIDSPDEQEYNGAIREAEGAE